MRDRFSSKFLYLLSLLAKKSLSFFLNIIEFFIDLHFSFLYHDQPYQLATVLLEQSINFIVEDEASIFL